MIARTLYAAAFFTAAFCTFLLSVTCAVAIGIDDEDIEERFKMGVIAVSMFLLSLVLAGTGFLIVGL